MAVHRRFIYRIMACELPSLLQLALTDDFTKFGKSPKDTPEHWYASFDLLADALAHYDALANPVGIFRHPDKGPRETAAPNEC